MTATPSISIVAVLSKASGNTAEKFVGTPSYFSVWFIWQVNELSGPAAPVGP